MSAAESDPKLDAEHPPLSESEHRSTRMTYGDARRVPLYVVGAWLVLLIAYATYHLLYVLPDLRAWMNVGK